MTRTDIFSSPDVLPHNIHEIFETDTFLSSLQINAAAPVSGGVAHSVYRIESSGGVYYIKIRGDHFVAIPSITCNPDDIIHEHRALTLFADAVPDHFPKILSFDPNRHYIILSDMIGNGNQLERVLTSGRIPEGLFELYGQTLATIQQNTSDISEPVRPEGDQEYYQTILGHRFGYRNHPVLNAAVNHLSQLPDRQLIMGDPAPKNMGINKKEDLLTFFDLETAHLGNPEFDYAYGLAHTLLQTMPDEETMQRSIQHFLSGYGRTPYDSQLIYQLSLGLVLYRLHSIIPYPTALTSEKKAVVEKHIEQQLFSITGKETWQDIVSRLTDI